MRKTWFFLISWFFVILSLPGLVLAMLCNRFGFSSFSQAVTDGFLAFLAKGMLWLSGSKVQIEGLKHLPQTGPVLFVSNHQGHFDSAVLLAYLHLPKSFIATAEAGKIPILKHWFALAQAIYFEKDNIRQNHSAMQKAQEIIETGRSVVIYPEGIISSSAEQGEFRRGAFKLAFRTGVPIVPMAINGTWQVMGPNSDQINPAQITLRILPAITTGNLTRLEQQELPGQLALLIKAATLEMAAKV